MPAKKAAAETVAEDTKVRFDPFENPGPLAEEEAAWLNEEFPGLKISASHVRAVISNHARFQKSPERQATREAEAAAREQEREDRTARHQKRLDDAAAKREAKEAAKVAREEAKAAKDAAAAPPAPKKAAARTKTAADGAKPAPKKRVSRRRTTETPAEDAF